MYYVYGQAQAEVKAEVKPPPASRDAGAAWNPVKYHIRDHIKPTYALYVYIYIYICTCIYIYIYIYNYYSCGPSSYIPHDREHLYLWI